MRAEWKLNVDYIYLKTGEIYTEQHLFKSYKNVARFIQDMQDDEKVLLTRLNICYPYFRSDN